MSDIQTLRKNIIEKNLDNNISDKSVLEIGALDSPTYTDKEIKVSFLDFASAEDLNKKSKNNSRYNLDKLVKVDYVCPTIHYSKYISESFDVVIANHVIEHIPDTIRWLKNINKILNDGGILFLSIPDKRFTFDIARNCTNFINLLRSYNDKVLKPDFYHLLEHFYYHKNIKSSDVWNGIDLSKKISQKRFDIKTAIANSQHFAKQDYADVHCHVFTYNSFIELTQELIEMGMCNFELVNTYDVQEGEIEFHIVLKKQLRKNNQRSRALKEIDIKDLIINKNIDFFDFGCSDGASLEFGKTLGGRVGLGIDINKQKIDQAITKGFLAVLYNINKIPDEKLVDFTIMSHFLEHVPNIHDAILFINKACSVSKNFVFIRQPFFDADGLLLKKGLKTFYSDWQGHPNKMSSLLFYTILRDLKDKGIIKSFIIGARGRISKSSHSIIHPLDSPIDQHDYDAQTHPFKDESIHFEFNVFSEIIIMISISKYFNQSEKLKIDAILYSSL